MIYYISEDLERARKFLSQYVSEDSAGSWDKNTEALEDLAREFMEVRVDEHEQLKKLARGDGE